MAAAISVPAFSIDWYSFPAPIHERSLLVSAAGNFGLFYPAFNISDGGAEKTNMYGGALSVDYAMPLGIPFALGFEAGFEWSQQDYYGTISSSASLALAYIPMALRIAWHPNFGIENLDVYLMAKGGYGIGFWLGSGLDYPDGTNLKGRLSMPRGMIFGTVIGGRYFFTENLAAFIEISYDHYLINYKYDTRDIQGEISCSGYAIKFATLGITYKIF